MTTQNIFTLAVSKAFDAYDTDNIDNIIPALRALEVCAINFGYINILDAVHTVWREQLAWGNGYVIESYEAILDDLYMLYPCKDNTRPAHWNVIN